jgi:integrase
MWGTFYRPATFHEAVMYVKRQRKTLWFSCHQASDSQHFISKGYDLSVIQAILGHKSPAKTNRYLKNTGVENVRDALEHLSIGACNNHETKEEEMGFDIFGGQLKKPS